jgi:hypothetical protein
MSISIVDLISWELARRRHPLSQFAEEAAIPGRKPKAQWGRKRLAETSLEETGKQAQPLYNELRAGAIEIFLDLEELGDIRWRAVMAFRSLSLWSLLSSKLKSLS